MRDRTDRPPVVVVTGASAGVGRAVVRAFARRGARLGLLARGTEGLEGARRDVEREGGRGVVLPTDVADPDQVEAAAARVEEAFGPIDVWINNAMVSVFSPVSRLSAAEVRRVTEVTYLGVVHGTMSALHRMRRRNAGTIVQVGSALAYRGIPLQAAYCAAKHAVQGFTESLRTELMAEGSDIHLTLVHLPAVNTPQFGWSRTRLRHLPQPVPPIFAPEVAAEAIVWAAGQRRREVLVGGPTVKAVMAQKLASRAADRHLARHGVEEQLGPELLDPDRPDNLWTPVEGDRGAHGPYEDRELDHSWQLWANQHRGTLAAAAGAVLGGAVAWYRSRGGARSEAAGST